MNDLSSAAMLPLAELVDFERTADWRAAKADEFPRAGSVMGATIAEMANHIRSNGGEVAGVVTLVKAGRPGKMTAEKHRIAEIERRFGDVVREELRIEPASLTADEAQFLLNHQDADALRDRIIARRDARSAQLRAKDLPGNQGEEGQGRSVDDDCDRYSIAAPQTSTPQQKYQWLADRLSDTLTKYMPALLNTPADSAKRIYVTPHQTMVYGDDERHRAWAAERMGEPGMNWPADTVTIGIERTTSWRRSFSSTCSWATVVALTLPPMGGGTGHLAV